MSWGWDLWLDRRCDLCGACLALCHGIIQTHQLTPEHYNFIRRYRCSCLWRQKDKRGTDWWNRTDGCMNSQSIDVRWCSLLLLLSMLRISEVSLALFYSCKMLSNSFYRRRPKLSWCASTFSSEHAAAGRKEKETMIGIFSGYVFSTIKVHTKELVLWKTC